MVLATSVRKASRSSLTIRAPTAAKSSSRRDSTLTRSSILTRRAFSGSVATSSFRARTEAPLAGTSIAGPIAMSTLPSITSPANSRAPLSLTATFLRLHRRQRGQQHLRRQLQLQRRPQLLLLLQQRQRLRQHQLRLRLRRVRWVRSRRQERLVVSSG